MIRPTGRAADLPIPTAAPSPPDLARCADPYGTLTPIFFSDQPLVIARAKAICARCPRREPCLRDALARREACGVWGGELLSDGQVVPVKRARGRPPKHPRPVPVVDELGIVHHPPSVA